MFCQECPKKPFCSTLCPEALTYTNQDQRPRREFFTLPEAKWRRSVATAEAGAPAPELSKTERKILTLLKKGLTRGETCEILEISRLCLRSHLAHIKAKIHGFPPLPG